MSADALTGQSSTRGDSVLFTIVTPVLNGMPWLPDCVASIVAQRGDVTIEHIILDGGSSDGSREWLRANEHLGYRAIFQDDDGQTDALIAGFGVGRGEIFGWLNADDLLELGALRVVQSVMAQRPDVVMVSGCCLLIDGEDTIIGLISVPPKESYEGLVRHAPNPAQPATFFRAASYRAVGGLDARFDLAMDIDLWLKLAGHGPILFLRENVLARFRLHRGAKSVISLTKTVRQDFHIRRANGMPLRSEAALDLVWAGYIVPAVRPVKRAVVGTTRRLVFGRSGQEA